MNTSDSRLYHKVTVSSWERCYSSSLQQVVQDNTFCSNYRENIGERIGKVVQEQCMKVAQVARKHSVRQRTTICSGANKRAEQNVRY